MASQFVTHHLPDGYQSDLTVIDERTQSALIVLTDPPSESSFYSFNNNNNQDDVEQIAMCQLQDLTTGSLDVNKDVFYIMPVSISTAWSVPNLEKEYIISRRRNRYQICSINMALLYANFPFCVFSATLLHFEQKKLIRLSCPAVIFEPLSDKSLQHYSISTSDCRIVKESDKSGCELHQHEDKFTATKTSMISNSRFVVSYNGRYLVVWSSEITVDTDAMERYPLAIWHIKGDPDHNLSTCLSGMALLCFLPGSLHQVVFAFGGKVAKIDLDQDLELATSTPLQLHVMDSTSHYCMDIPIAPKSSRTEVTGLFIRDDSLVLEQFHSGAEDEPDQTVQSVLLDGVWTQIIPDKDLLGIESLNFKPVYKTMSYGKYQKRCDEPWRIEKDDKVYHLDVLGRVIFQQQKIIGRADTHISERPSNLHDNRNSKICFVRKDVVTREMQQVLRVTMMQLKSSRPEPSSRVNTWSEVDLFVLTVLDSKKSTTLMSIPLAISTSESVIYWYNDVVLVFADDRIISVHVDDP